MRSVLSRLRPLAFALLAACSGAPTEEAEDPAMVGWTAAREGDDARAAVAYREATVLHPTDAEAFLGLARAELRAGRPETAARAAERAVALRPESADAHELLGRARLARDEAAPAVTALTRALELDPERARLHFALARAHERAQQRDEAIAAYRASADAGVLAARSLVSVARIEIDRPLPGGELAAIEAALDRAEELAGEDEVVRAAIIRERRRVEQKRRSVWGEDTALGNDPMTALGALMGDQIGSNFGFGGLGLRGTGGSGGTGEGTIGLGNLGTIGQRGGGVGTGEGRGIGSLDAPAGDAPGLGTLGRGAGFPREGGGDQPLFSQVRLAGPVVSGALSAEVVRRIHRRYLGQVRYCYERELRAQPALAGSITLAITVGPTGAVTGAETRGSTLGSDAVASCMVTMVRRWAYPAPESGVVQVTQAITLAPRP